jgi:hypothetical protein
MARKFFLTVAALASVFSVSAFAHHSFAAEYDRNKPVTLEGVVTKLEWQNPHTRFYLDVKDAAGNVVNWELELGSPNGLMRAGWTRHSLQEGMKVTVKGSLAKDGSHLANASTITLSDGKLVLSGVSSGDNPATK